MPLHINSNYGVLNNEYSIRILLVVKTVLMVTFTACSLVHHLLEETGLKVGNRKEKGEGKIGKDYTSSTFYDQLQALVS